VRSRAFAGEGAMVFLAGRTRATPGAIANVTCGEIGD
jgi:hypothetical protein